MRAFQLALLLVVGLAAVDAEVLVSKGLLALGDLTTEDNGGPYAIPAVQAFEVQGATYAKTGGPIGFTDADVLSFLVNTECLEARFDTYAAFGGDIPADLLSDGAGPIMGAKKAALSNQLQPYIEEVALDEQGHVRLIREVLGDRSPPCPPVDVMGGFNAFFKKALNYTGTATFDPFANDVNFLVSMWTLEEIGATGDKGSIALVSNPGIANAIAGLATSASYQSGVDRHMMWLRRNETVEPFGVSLHDMVQAISNLRDDLDGPQDDDQGLTNTDTNTIAVPTDFINLVPTDIRGLCFSRTPQQVLRILTIGSADGKGGFFPKGVNGRINNTLGYDKVANGYAGYEGNKVTVLTLAQAGEADRVNKTVMLPPPAPQPIQLEASGREYPGYTKPSGMPYSAIYMPATTTTATTSGSGNTASTGSGSTASGAGASTSTGTTTMGTDSTGSSTGTATDSGSTGTTMGSGSTGSSTGMATGIGVMGAGATGSDMAGTGGSTGPIIIPTVLPTTAGRRRLRVVPV
jgi:hypothetical protein